MNEQHRWFVVLTLVLAFSLGLYVWHRERRLAAVEADAASTKEILSRRNDLEDQRSFMRLEEAAARLSDSDPKERKEAIVRFHQELHRFKVRHLYPQLRASKPKEADP